MKKDKSYYVNLDGEVVRIRAPKKPNKSTIEALTALVTAARNKLKTNDEKTNPRRPT